MVTFLNIVFKGFYLYKPHCGQESLMLYLYLKNRLFVLNVFVQFINKLDHVYIMALTSDHTEGIISIENSILLYLQKVQHANNASHL